MGRKTTTDPATFGHPSLVNRQGTVTREPMELKDASERKKQKSTK